MESPAAQDAAESSPLLQPASSTPSPSSLSNASPSQPPPPPHPAHALPALSTPTKQQLRESAPVPVSPSALARPGSAGRLKTARTVTFDPNPVTRTIEPPPSTSPPVHAIAPLSSRLRGSAPPATVTTPALSATAPLSYGTTSSASSTRPGTAGSGGPPVLSAINNRLRRRNSYGSGPLGMTQPPMQLPKIGPQRSTKNAQKLKLLPNPEFGDEGPDEESGRDVYSQYTRIKDPTARRDAALLGKADRARLPRVTAYCTANRYDMDGLVRFLKGRGKTRGGNPKLIDECIYTPYDYDFSKNGGEADGFGGGGSNRRNRISHHSYIGGGSGHVRHRGVDEDAERHEQQRQKQQQQQQQQQQERDELQRQQQEQQQDQPYRDVDRQRDSQLLPSASYYQERRHSAGEADAGHTIQRRDDLIDLDGGSQDERNRQSEQAIADDDEIMPRSSQQTDDGGYNNGHEDGSYFDDNLHEQHDDRHNQSQRGQLDQEQHHHMIHRHQRQAEEAVLDLLSGDELDRQAAGNDHNQLRDEFEQQLRGERPVDFDIHVHTPELFLFDYGVVVIWGMSEAQEQRFLKELAKFELEKLAADDMEVEFFNFYYTREYQARIYNDFIALRDKNNYMTKLAISHALAQSVKTSLFEELIASTIDTCKDIPTQIALTGTIALNRTEINMQIGELFILRINIHLNGSVLDTPELFWVEPQLEPVYQAVRSYLEMDQRVGLLTQRLDVIADLLAVLKEQLSHGHGEKLEWIAEILVAAINIVVDLYAGV
ncbi:hypothetical protein SPBR_06693 [Sporothrix brasiliensis 5110]|uniref:DUF155 domain-containing protein n=1 Tax=Sporothrix brasiliensis 5110 TaxID=1398154 RepID=A0A0C2IMP6_9PEZI|nr:uncharacterized protein SPBR_06693 [Sporothrix brasiliensis 5110]KIH88295.1 hypothetical protein SPBR_06693 [Sporothrix brasiliensis 5110]